MVSKEEVYELLRHLELFRDLDNSELEVVASRARVAVYQPASTIVEEFERPNGFFVTLQGRVSVMKLSRSGDLREIAVIEPGKMIGEMALFENYERSATLVSKERVTLLFFSKEDFLKCLEEHPKMGVKLLLKIGRRLSSIIRSTTESYLEAIQA